MFLELFSGCGRLAAGVARNGRWALCWDVAFGEEYNLLIASRQQLVRGWVASGLVAGIHMGLPCESFTRARDHGPGPPPLRSNALPMGLTDLRPGDQAAVVRGNALLRFAISIFKTCAVHAVPCSLENPRLSRVWITPPWLALERALPITSHICDYCMFGMPWKKPTIFASLGLCLHSAFEGRRCLGAPRGLCARTGRPHTQLSGQDEHGAWRTRLAQPYPVRLCNAYAKAFEHARCASRGPLSASS